uniref:Uncharacterized protein n=1 Tax=Meloidogyne floridensis TaxID=298350 RepID=A0A915PAK8_9BILA
MSSINILIIFIYFIFVLFQFSASQQCSNQYEKCNDSDKKCCTGLNCKNTEINKSFAIFAYKCFKAGCVQKGNRCDDNGRMCCYGLKCVYSICKECLVDGSKCNASYKCCTGMCNSETRTCY